MTDYEFRFEIVPQQVPTVVQPEMISGDDPLEIVTPTYHKEMRAQVRVGGQVHHARKVFDPVFGPKAYTGIARHLLDELAHHFQGAPKVGFPAFDVSEEVLWERAKQNARWGEQNHPMHASAVDSIQRQAWRARLETVRESEQWARDTGRLDWALILLEEVYEALTADSEEEAEEELIQVAAVAVAAIEAIRRRRQRKGTGWTVPFDAVAAEFGYSPEDLEAVEDE